MNEAMKQCSNETMKLGVSLYLALIIMTILLAIGLGLTVIILGQMRMIRGMGDSVIAFHAADTGIERILYEDKICHQADCSPPCRSICDGLENGTQFPGNLDNGISYNVSHERRIEGPLDCHTIEIEETCCPDFNGDGAVTNPTCGDDTPEACGTLEAPGTCPNTPEPENLRHDACLLWDHLYTTPASPNWDPMYDLIDNNVVDADDVFSKFDQYKEGKVCKYIFYNFRSTGTFEKTKRAIEVTIY